MSQWIEARKIVGNHHCTQANLYERSHGPMAGDYCGDRAAVLIELHGRVNESLCVRHALEFVARINTIIVESTEEG
jgi:hypothetical protein